MAESLLDLAIRKVIDQEETLTLSEQRAVVDVLSHIFNESARTAELNGTLDPEVLAEWLDTFSFEDWDKLDFA